MKTLSTEVQAVIVTEAGSIYRNVLLSCLKEYGVINHNHAKESTQHFITMILDNIADAVERTDAEIDYSTIDEALRHG